MKLTNYSNDVKKFLIDISKKYLVTKKFVMQCLVIIVIQNGNLS